MHMLTSPAVLAEITDLPESATLIQHGPWRVVHIRPGAAPATLVEIGRQRARTFRAAGMGVDSDVDLDRFDASFDQLVLVNDDDQAIAGGYRIGWCDEILARQGLEGLYLPTMFRVGSGLQELLPHAVEVGRSFIAPEYQRQLRPLGLLWNAIGIAIARRGGQTWALFGSVSISAELAPDSRASICGFLRRHLWHRELAPAVRGVNPVQHDVDAGSATTFRELSRELEDDECAPVLLRKYAQLGGRYLGFNVDPDFGDSIDCLVWVDLRDTDPRRLEGYVGSEVRAILQGDVQLAAG